MAASQGAPLSPPPEVEFFYLLIASQKKKLKLQTSKFVKKLDEIPEGPMKVAISLAKQALIG